MQPLPWIVASLALFGLLGVAASAWLFGRRNREPRPLPAEWGLSPRPVFSTDERRVYRQLREALPHHIVLAKLPLVRFCQPNDPEETRFWFELLGAIHVTFAICSANGRVLAAIDLDTDRGHSKRLLQIKQSVLGACRVRYLRCPLDHLPSIPELQLLVPQAASVSRGPQPASSVNQARDILATTVAARRRERTALWKDSSVFQDSFFAPDNRLDLGLASEFGSLVGARLPAREPPAAAPSADDTGGLPDDAPRYGNSRRG